MTADCSFVITTPSELIAAVPYLMGYHPADGVAVVGLAGTQVAFAACYDLPPPDLDEGEADEEATIIAEAVARQESRTVVIVGYGVPTRVTPAVLRLAQAVQMLGVRVNDVMRVTDGRWWSYLCGDPACCPMDGTPCLPGDSVIAAEATFRGIVALPSRRHLTAQVAAVEGAARSAMRTATERARRRFTDLVADDLEKGGGRPARQDGPEKGGGRAVRQGGPERYGRLIRRAGRTAVRDAERRYRAGRTLTDDETAWLGVLLVDKAVQDYALDRSGADEWRVRLWTDVLRRMEPAYVAAPACLLSFTAWRTGNGPLARVAVDRALREEPAHQLAGMMHEVLGYGLGPHMLRRSGDGPRTRARRRAG